MYILISTCIKLKTGISIWIWTLCIYLSCILMLYIYVCIYYAIYIYIYIYISDLKYIDTNYLKPQIFLFFSEVLSMWNQITNENTDNSAT